MKLIFKKSGSGKGKDKPTQKAIHGTKDFETFYHNSIKKLIHITYKIVGDKDAAESIVHDVLIDIWERRDDITITFSLEAYAIKAAKFKSFDYLKKKIKTEKLQQEVLDLHPNSHNDVEEELYANELKARVRDLTDLLPKRCQEVFRLSREKAMSNREIAKGLQISEKAVEKHMTKAIKHLRLGLEKS